MRATRLPADFPSVLASIRQPESGVQLIVCARNAKVPGRDALALGTTAIEIPSLEARRSEVPRIIREYLKDAITWLDAPDGSVRPADVEWIIQRSVIAKDLAIPDIEKAVLRLVAFRKTGNMTRAADLLGMRAVSLTRWFRRRDYAP